MTDPSGPAATAASHVAPTARDLEDDLRARGLPLVVRPSVRRRALVRRCGPVLWTVAWVLCAIALLDRAMDVLEPELLAAGGQIEMLQGETVVLVAAGMLVLGSAGLLLSPLVLWGSVVLTRLVPRRVQQGSAVAAIIAAVALPVLVEGDTALLSTLVTSVLSVLGVLLASYVGLGTLLPWSALRVVRELWTLGPMVARVLPVLLITFLFCFYNAEIWQIAMVLSTQRTWWTVGVILLLTVVLVVVTTRDEFGITGIAGELDDEGHLPTRAERINVRAVPVLVIGIQVLICSLLTFLFFVGFGVLSVPPGTIAQWISRPATPLFSSLPQFPVSLELARVSLVLAAFAGLNFAAGASSDARHREVFLTPVLDEVREGLAVRREYLDSTS